MFTYVKSKKLNINLESGNHEIKGYAIDRKKATIVWFTIKQKPTNQMRIISP